MSTIISVPLSNQLQVAFIEMRNVFEVRERHSRMYSWSALVTSQILIEIPWNILGSSLYFLCWYWTVGFPTDRAGFTYFMMGVWFPLYYTTIGQAVASMSPNAEIAALLFSFLFSFVLTFDGVIQPYRALGWWQWMYRLSPYTYLIEALLGQGTQCFFTLTRTCADAFSLSARETRHPLLRYRTRHDPAALGPDVLAVHGPVHRERRRVPQQPRRDQRLRLLLVRHHRCVPRTELQHLLLAPLARPRHLRRLHFLQRKSPFTDRLVAHGADMGCAHRLLASTRSRTSSACAPAASSAR